MIEVKIRGTKEFAQFSRKEEAIDNTVIVGCREQNWHMEIMEDNVRLILPGGEFKGTMKQLDMIINGE